MQSLLVHEAAHIFFYSLLVFVLYLLSWVNFSALRSGGLSFTSSYRKLGFSVRNYLIGLFATIFIDLDHLIDYFVHKNIFMFKGFDAISASSLEFLTGAYFETSGKVYVLFHAWEYVALLLIAFLWQKRTQDKGFLLFIALGIAAHLLLDAATYNMAWDTYFLLSRIKHDFLLVAF